MLLAADGPRVIDFGIARAADGTSMTRTGLAIGSPGFMAPEQAEGLPVTAAVDVFALGAVAAYAVLGRSPFGTGNDAAMLYRIVHRPPELDGCPPSLRDLIERCLAKVPGQRPSPGEIIDQCRARTTGHPLQIAQSWLPAAVSADLASHLPPTAPPTVPPTAPPRPHEGADAPEPSTLRQPTAPHEPTATVHPDWARPGGPPSPHAAGRRRVSRRTLIGAAVALVLAAGLGGQQTLFTGSGAIATLRPDGTGTTAYHDTVFSADVDGVEWTQTFLGSSTGHWSVRNGDILFSGVSVTGTVVLATTGSSATRARWSPRPASRPISARVTRCGSTSPMAATTS